MTWRDGLSSSDVNDAARRTEKRQSRLIVSGVPTYDLGVMWPLVLPLFVAGAKRTGETFDATLWVDRLSRLRATLWIVYEVKPDTLPAIIGGVLTCLLEDGAILVGPTTGRRFPEWGPAMLALIESWMRSQGLSRLEAQAARRGWARWAMRYGFTPCAGDGPTRWYAKEI